jgi:hypothetical protein
VCALSFLGVENALWSISNARQCWQGSPEPRVPVISSSRRKGDMEWFGHNPVGINHPTGPPTRGGHDIYRAALGCVRSGSHPA